MLVALLSVAVALVYSAVQAKDSARQVEINQRAVALSARASELSSVLELHAKIVDADRMTTAALQRVRASRGDPRAVAKLIGAVTSLEAIAYLLRHDRTGIPRAAEIWKRYLVCSFYTARAGVGPSLDSYVPELGRFARAEQRTLGPAERRCTLVLLPR